MSSFIFRPRAPVAKHIEPAVESPSILRKTENYTWTPRDITIEAVSIIISKL